MRFPHVEQHDEKDCGAACLSMVAEYYGAKYKIAKIRDLIKVDNKGASMYGLVMGAKGIGLKAEGLEGEFEDLVQGVKDGELAFPIIARIINEFGFEHYIVVYNIDEKKVVVGDPGKTSITNMDVELFKLQWQGQIMTFTVTDEFTKVNEKKGAVKKYFRYILNQKKMLLFVFIMSLIVTFINISGVVVFRYVVNTATAIGENTDNPTMADSQDAMLQDGISLTTDLQGTNLQNSDQQITDADISESDGTGNDTKAPAGIHAKGNASAGSNFMTTLNKLEQKLSVVFANLNTVCISIIILYLLRFFLSILRGYLLALTAKRVDVPLTLDYYDHLMDLPVEFYGTRKTGEYMSRFYDTGKIRDAISSTTLTVMLDTILAIACGIVLFNIDHKLFLITMVILVVYATIMFVFKRPIKKINHALMEQEAQVTSYLKESIDGVETLKAFHSTENAKIATNALYQRFANLGIKASLIYNIMNSLVMTCEAIGIVALLWSGAMLCVNGVISLADLMMYYYLINYFLDPVKNLINLQPQLQTAFVAAERLNDILDADREDYGEEETVDLTGDVEVKDVDFRYGHRQIVLDNISMTFKGGKKTAIVGESGCGKTTLVKLLMKFYFPEKGTIEISGNDINKLSTTSVRKKVSYVSQDIFLFSDTIYNNLRMGDQTITDAEIEEVCKLCYADEFISKLPNGYMTTIEENGRDLSGGQRQRLAIARAILKKPDILVLDEATSNLDTITEKSIKETIDKLSANMTCIIIAHRLNTIKNCDYIYVMDRGHVVEEGTHDSLLGAGGFYAKLNLEN